MNEETDIAAMLPVAPLDEPLVEDDGVRATVAHVRDDLRHIEEAVDLSHREPVVHRHDNCPARVAVHDPFDPDVFSDHLLHLQDFQCLFDTLVRVHDTGRGPHELVRGPVLEGVAANRDAGRPACHRALN